MTLAIACVQCGVCVRAFAHLAQLMYFIYYLIVQVLFMVSLYNYCYSDEC